MEAFHLFNQIDGGLKIQTKINEIPGNSFSAVFLLFKNEHGVIEELLEFLISVVYAKLLKGVNLRKVKIRNSE